MMTVKDYLSQQCPNTAFLSMPDVLKWTMTHTLKDTLHGGNGRDDRLEFHQEFIKEAMTETNHDAEDLNAELETYAPKKRHRERDADAGNLDVERYLDGDQKPFIDVFTEAAPRPAKTILMEIGANARERDDLTTMRQRHRHIYAEVLKAEAQGEAVRVIAVDVIKYDERPDQLKRFIVIKDYLDPIFPEIWGALKTCACINSFSNLMSYTIFGTHDPGNGHHGPFKIDGDFSDDEELIIIDPKRMNPPPNAKVITTDGQPYTPPPPEPPRTPRPRYITRPRVRRYHRRRRSF
jgi:hypothetical protein